MNKCPFIISILLLFSTLSHGQSTAPTRFMELGLSANSYKGDLSPTYDKWTSSFHLGLKLNIKKKLNGQFNFMAGNIVGENPTYDFTNSNSPRPNNYFNTRLGSVNYNLQYHFIKTEKWMFCISQGFGLMKFTPRNELSEDLIVKTSTRARNETYSSITAIFPTNIGLTYLFPNYYGIGFQVGFLNPATDYLDNVSQLSNNQRKDNVLLTKFIFSIPISYAD
jgi:hypothetical protein